MTEAAVDQSPTPLAARAGDTVRATTVEDIIPVPILAVSFIVLFLTIGSLLSPGWSENMRAVLARRAAREGNWERAVSYYEVLITTNPRNPSYWGELAHAQMVLDRNDAAVENYRKATEILMSLPPPSQEERGVVAPKPDHYSADIGQALFQAGNLTEAKSYLERYLQNIDRRHANSLRLMAEITLREGDLERAAMFMAAAKDNGASEETLQPIREAILKQRLPEELR